ncbi:MAG TPA: hypothetical protein VJM15_07200 [Sphingomicrobium sp.]|nr:hypothetical protein [Sphingomicrobium sp.]
MPAALDCAKRDRIDHDPRLEARLDDEQAAELPQHAKASQSLTQERLAGSFEPFAD